jgi:hypothetical protein
MTVRLTLWVGAGARALSAKLPGGPCSSCINAAGIVYTGEAGTGLPQDSAPLFSFRAHCEGADGGAAVLMDAPIESPGAGTVM